MATQTQDSFLNCGLLRSDAALSKNVADMSKVDVGLDKLKTKLSATEADRKALRILRGQKRKLMEALKEFMISHEIECIPISNTHVLAVQEKTKKHPRLKLPDGLSAILVNSPYREWVATVEKIAEYCNEIIEEKDLSVVKRVMTNKLREDFGLDPVHAKKKAKKHHDEAEDIEEPDEIDDEDDEDDVDDEEDEDEKKDGKEWPIA